MSVAPEVTDKHLQSVAVATMEDIALLYDDLLALANNNSSFKSGDLDTVSFSLTEGERRMPQPEIMYDEKEIAEFTPEQLAAYESVEELSSMLDGHCKTSFMFEAERFRRIEDGRQAAAILFRFEVSVCYLNAPVPPLMAERITGLPAEEAVRRLGLKTVEQIERYSFNPSEDYPLYVCTAKQLLDSEGRVVYGVCSCPADDEVMYRRRSELIMEEDMDAEDYDEDELDDETYEDDEDGEESDTLTIEEDPIVQITAIALAEKHSNEPLVLDVDTDIDVPTEWAAQDEMATAVDFYGKQQEVDRAHLVLQNIQVALLRQAGVEVEYVREG